MRLFLYQDALVGLVGLEPTRPKGHRSGNSARLPIPPQTHYRQYKRTKTEQQA